MRASSPFCKDGKPSGFDLQIGKFRLLAALSSSSGITKALLKLVDSSCGIHKALLTGEERMTCGANTDVEILNSRSRLHHIAASALDGCFVVFRVDFRFHSRRKF